MQLIAKQQHGHRAAGYTHCRAWTVWQAPPSYVNAVRRRDLSVRRMANMRWKAFCLSVPWVPCSKPVRSEDLADALGQGAEAESQCSWQNLGVSEWPGRGDAERAVISVPRTRQGSWGAEFPLRCAVLHTHESQVRDHAPYDGVKAGWTNRSKLWKDEFGRTNYFRAHPPQRAGKQGIVILSACATQLYRAFQLQLRACLGRLDLSRRHCARAAQTHGPV